MYRFRSVRRFLLLVGLTGCSESIPVAAVADDAAGGQSRLSAYRLARWTPNSSVLSEQAGNSLLSTAFSLESIVRLPAETNSPVPLANGDTAYFRDVAVSTTHTITATTDGQTFRLDLVYPDGSRDQGATLTFRSTFNGQSDCFVFGLGSLCGGTQIFLFLDINVQCAPNGLYRLEPFVNGAPESAAVGEFQLIPMIPPGTYTTYDQGDFSTPYDSACAGTNGSIRCRGVEGEVKKTIAQKGCLLTAAAMALSYFQVQTRPDSLDAWLNRNAGYSGPGDLVFPTMANRAAESGVQLTAEPVEVNTTTALRGLICRYGPQVVKVRPRPGASTHFVLAIGIEPDSNDVLIDDPGRPATLLRPQYLGFESVRQLRRTTGTSDTLRTGLVVTVFSPAHLLLTDPLGRRVGFDPSDGRLFAEVPGSAYDSVAGLSNVLPDGSFGPDDLDQPKQIELTEAVTGVYTVDLEGTGTGTYELAVSLFGNANRIASLNHRDIPIAPGEKHRYAFTYDPAAIGVPGVPSAGSGGFTGGGQSAQADAILTYARPGQRQTTLAQGSTRYRLLIFYASGTVPESFLAELNGSNVSALFTPVAGTSEMVEIPLSQGRNVLKLRADGSLGSRVLSDADNLVFIVP